MVSGAVTDKETIEAELAIVAVGMRPESKLAKEAGLGIGPRGDITVDDYLQTSDPDIYAGGDCVANLNIVTGQKGLSANGSTANKHGHIIAANITGGKEKFPGIINSRLCKSIRLQCGKDRYHGKTGTRAGIQIRCRDGSSPRSARLLSRQ